MNEFETERGFLLIADMVDSTRAKYQAGEPQGYELVLQHNRTVISECSRAKPQAGEVINVLGDGVVVKFPFSDDEQSAIVSSLTAAKRIARKFDGLTVELKNGGVWDLRTKITLQYYERAFKQALPKHASNAQREIAGVEIDLAFRLSALAWRLQVLATDSFMRRLLQLSSDEDGRPTDWTPESLLSLARSQRERPAGDRRSDSVDNIAVELRLKGLPRNSSYFVSDARTVANLKGIDEPRHVFLVSFEHPNDVPTSQRRIKLRQDFHAVIMVNITTRGETENYIRYIAGELKSLDHLDAEFTLCVAAGLFGDNDFVFRVSCADEASLKRFYEKIRHSDHYLVESISVKQTVRERFWVNQAHSWLLEKAGLAAAGIGQRKAWQLVLTWFEDDDAHNSLFNRFLADMRADELRRPKRLDSVHILEAGEVIDRTPVYALVLCKDLAAYTQFIQANRIKETSCRSHIVQMRGSEPMELRYGLVHGIFVRQPTSDREPQSLLRRLVRPARVSGPGHKSPHAS